MGKRKMRKEIVLLGIVLLFAFVGTASAATWTVEEGESIPDAVNAASAGDTIIVNSGTYYENVNVNKQLILRGVDTGGGKPVVDAGGSDNAITLSADRITLEGFNATNSGSALLSSFRFMVSNSNTVTSNNFNSNKGLSFSLESSSNNNITGNTFVHDGLFVDRSYQNTVEDNIVNGQPLLYLEERSDIKLDFRSYII
jgi:parallel beta-helix repeat protein